MKTVNITVSYTQFDHIDELPEDYRQLVMAAKEASMRAYAPYSGFKVGAAILLSGGTIVKGANVENAAYPSGNCAEKNALANCVTNYPGEVPVCIAIAATGKGGKVDDNISPCGMCRQVIAEEETRTGRKIKILLYGNSGISVIESISDLLPLQFNKENLRIALP